MPEPSTLALFLTAALALFIVPGPSVLYIVTRSIHQGRTAGLVSVLGIHLGSLVHVAAAAFGLSALLVSSAFAYNAVKYLGAAYLIGLGLRTLREKSESPEVQIRPNGGLRRAFWQGALVNVLNPKTALFFLAFLPQFVDVKRGPVTLQVLVLGVLFILAGIMSDGTYALVAARAGRWLRASNRFARRQRLFSGSIYLGLGVAALASGRKP